MPDKTMTEEEMRSFVKLALHAFRIWYNAGEMADWQFHEMGSIGHRILSQPKKVDNGK